ncbi:hypothetical protein [Microcoleus vaginatus]|uniref:hypothetical protein n=1 Tax=Microcoleus vaginatus TaxID=119532 RepID=UPI0016821ACA|nr:hypothetical protein [Microcoleus sp. FACHB-84]MBD2009378.1 hypothetical protein [Microcoleus sp. FACHB-45]
MNLDEFFRLIYLRVRAGLGLGRSIETPGQRFLAQKIKNEAEVTENSPIPPKVAAPVALCLVVPASVVENVRENSPIDVSGIEKLIDNSLYFLCTTPEDADATWDLLDRTDDEDITTVSEQREIYVRINIAEGEDMIGKKVPYILKRNLPSNGQGVVRQLACLKYLSVSGLENFNRI